MEYQFTPEEASLIRIALLTYAELQTVRAREAEYLGHPVRAHMYSNESVKAKAIHEKMVKTFTKE